MCGRHILSRVSCVLLSASVIVCLQAECAEAQTTEAAFRELHCSDSNASPQGNDIRTASDCSSACDSSSPYDCLGYTFEEIVILDYVRCECSSCFHPPSGESSTFTLCEDDRDYTIVIIIGAVAAGICLLCCLSWYFCARASQKTSSDSDMPPLDIDSLPPPMDIPPAYPGQDAAPPVGYPVSSTDYAQDNYQAYGYTADTAQQPYPQQPYPPYPYAVYPSAGPRAIQSTTSSLPPYKQSVV